MLRSTAYFFEDLKLIRHVPIIKNNTIYPRQSKTMYPIKDLYKIMKNGDIDALMRIPVPIIQRYAEELTNAIENHYCKNIPMLMSYLVTFGVNPYVGLYDPAYIRLLRFCDPLFLQRNLLNQAIKKDLCDLVKDLVTLGYSFDNSHIDYAIEVGASDTLMYYCETYGPTDTIFKHYLGQGFDCSLANCLNLGFKYGPSFDDINDYDYQYIMDIVCDSSMINVNLRDRILLEQYDNIIMRCDETMNHRLALLTKKVTDTMLIVHPDFLYYKRILRCMTRKQIRTFMSIDPDFYNYMSGKTTRWYRHAIIMNQYV